MDPFQMALMNLLLQQMGPAFQTRGIGQAGAAPTVLPAQSPGPQPQPTTPQTAITNPVGRLLGSPGATPGSSPFIQGPTVLPPITDQPQAAFNPTPEDIFAMLQSRGMLPGQSRTGPNMVAPGQQAPTTVPRVSSSGGAQALAAPQGPQLQQGTSPTPGGAGAAPIPGQTNQPFQTPAVTAAGAAVSNVLPATDPIAAIGHLLSPGAGAPATQAQITAGQPDLGTFTQAGQQQQQQPQAGGYDPRNLLPFLALGGSIVSGQDPNSWQSLLSRSLMGLYQNQATNRLQQGFTDQFMGLLGGQDSPFGQAPRLTGVEQLFLPPQAQQSALAGAQAQFNLQAGAAAFPGQQAAQAQALSSDRINDYLRFVDSASRAKSAGLTADINAQRLTIARIDAFSAMEDVTAVISHEVDPKLGGLFEVKETIDPVTGKKKTVRRFLGQAAKENRQRASDINIGIKASKAHARDTAMAEFGITDLGVLGSALAGGPEGMQKYFDRYLDVLYNETAYQDQLTALAGLTGGAAPEAATPLLSAGEEGTPDNPQVGDKGKTAGGQDVVFDGTEWHAVQ